LSGFPCNDIERFLIWNNKYDYLMGIFTVTKVPLSSLHKTFGKLYVILILLLSAPSGMVMALYANGGALTKLSFLILTPLWWYFTLKGYLTIRPGRLSSTSEMDD
jgi:hypothetical protein